MSTDCSAQHPWKWENEVSLALNLLDALLFTPIPFAPLKARIYSSEEFLRPHFIHPKRNDAAACGDEMTSAMTDIHPLSQMARLLRAHPVPQDSRKNGSCEERN